MCVVSTNASADRLLLSGCISAKIYPKGYPLVWKQGEDLQFQPVSKHSPPLVTFQTHFEGLSSPEKGMQRAEVQLSPVLSDSH